MKEITLTAVPNQELSFSVGDDRFEVRIKAARLVMAMDITINDVVVIQGARVLAGVPVIVYPHLMTHGNLAILTDNDELPDWRKFGDTQTLVYWTDEEYQNERRP